MDSEDREDRLEPASSDASARAVSYSSQAYLGPIAIIVAQHRDEIVARWLQVDCQQPFHQGEPDQHVADHIPRLLDGLGDVLARAAEPSASATPPADDPEIADAARQHARTRAAQGLKAAEIMTEFRLLRQEIWRALRTYAPSDLGVDNFLAAEVLINDALDNAIRVSLELHARELEEARSQIEHAREEAERQKEELLTAVAHDLKTPITSAKGFLQLAQRWWTSGEYKGRVKEAFEQAAQAHERIMRLVEEFLDVAQLGSAPLDLVRKPVRLASLLEKVVAEEGHRERVRLQLSVGDLTGSWDEHRLQRVFENVLGNALKYSPPHEMVTITAQREGGDAVVEVRDRGIGIPADELPYIFDRFHRARNAAGRIPGTGVGLAYAKQVVEQLRGSIAVSTEEGSGSTFTIRLPLSSDAPN